MYSSKNLKRYIQLLHLCFLWAFLVAPAKADLPAGSFRPVSFRLDGRAAMLEVEEGTRRVRVQVQEGKERGWQTHSITHLDGRAGHLKLRIPDSVPISAVRIETSNSDPFSSSLYSGKTSFSETADEQGTGANRGVVNLDAAAEDGALAAEEGGEVTVEESDIWKWRGRNLYFFNQNRGLQVFSLDDLDAPSRVAQLRMPAAGEQLYLVGEEHVILLANAGSSYWRGGSSVGSEVVLVRHQSDQLSVEQRYSLEGSFVESRMVGDQLYVVTRIWENVMHIDGKWRTRSGIKIYAFNFADPSDPVELKTLDLTGEDSYYYNAVVTATPDYLFVVPSIYDSERRNQVSWVHVIEIDEPDQPMEVSRRIPLGGRLNDKFKLALREGVLTTVSQVWNNGEERTHTLVENHDLRGDSDQPVRRLDSLMLAPGETVRATRFNGDRLYVVTFRQIDPLFAVDLSRPRRLRVLGHIDIPGWSTYMEIFGDLGRILSVGVEGSRVAVSLFDIADPTAMKLSKRVYLGDEGGHSWSEGNYDEKAVGFFPNDELLVLPFTGQVNGSYQKQMQIMDIGEDTLTKRGVINSDFMARRGKLFDENKLVIISGQQLRVVDIENRDEPAVRAELSIAWSAERVLLAGDYLIQLEGGYSSWWSSEDGLPTSLRITSAADPDTLISELKIATGDQLIGANVRGQTVYLATSRTNSTAIEREDGSNYWVYSTFFSTHTVDVSDPAVPVLTGSVEKKISDYSDYLGSMRAQFLPGGKVLWVPDGADIGSYPCMRCIGIAEDVMFEGPDFWAPSGSGSWLIVTDSSDASEPRILSTTRMIDNDDYPESWVETGPVFLSGSIASFGCHVSSWSGRRHTGQHFLRQFDFSNPSKPIMLKGVNVPGLLKHLYTTESGGTVLFTTRQKTELDKEDRAIWSSDLVIEASVFDGISAFLIDSVEVEEAFYSSISSYGRFIFISLNDGGRWWWGIPEESEQENGFKVLAWSDAENHIESLPNITTQSYVTSMAVVDDLLFAFDYGAVEVIALTDLPDTPRSDFFELSTGYSNPRSSAVEISAKERTAWIATGSYGVEALDIGELSRGKQEGPLQLVPKDEDQEWGALDIDPLQLVDAVAEDFIGSIPAGYGWRFQPLADRVFFDDWSKRHFDPDLGLPVPLAGSDTDGDGVSNLMEFFIGTRPDDPISVARPIMLLLEQEGGTLHLALSFAPDPSADGVTVFAEISEDLVEWKDATESVMWQQHGPVNSVRLVEAIDSDRPVYLRFSVRIGAEE